MKWWLKLIIAFIVVILIAFVGISIYLGASMTRSERVAVEGSPADLGREYEDVEFASREDDLTLRGWLLPAGNSQRTVIMVHGNGSNRADPGVSMLAIASAFIDRGFNVLMFDLRGHGESDGDRISAGYYEQRDLLGAVDYARLRGAEHVGVLGFSVGAATALLTAADEETIEAVVADSSFADLSGIMGREFKERSGFPEFFLKPVLFLVKIFYGVDFAAVKPVAAVADIAPRPILFIHGAEDTFVPVENAHRLYEAAANPEDELWIVPGADHVQAYNTAPDEYMDKVAAFFEAALK
jgi:fermentation-respiration switch protein FrsA (DUF1100 family)